MTGTSRPRAARSVSFLFAVLSKSFYTTRENNCPAGTFCVRSERSMGQSNGFRQSARIFNIKDYVPSSPCARAVAARRLTASTGSDLSWFKINKGGEYGRLHNR